MRSTQNSNQRRTIAVARSTPTKMHITGRSSMSVQMGKTKNRGNEVKPVVIDPLPMETFGRIESFDPIVRNIADQLFNCDSEINEVLAQKTVSNKSLFKDYHNELMRHFNRSHEVLEQVSLCRQKLVVQLKEYEKKLNELIHEKQSTFQKMMDKKKYLQAECQTIIQNISGFRQEKEELNTKISQYQQFMETFSTKKESYELKINTLKEQKMALEKKQESEMETKKECEEKQKVLVSRYNALLLAAEKIESDYQLYMNTVIKELREKENDLKEKQQDLQERFKKMKETNQKKLDELNETYTNLVEEKKTLDTNILDYEKQVKKATEQLNETKQYIQQLETDKKCLNDQLSKMSEQHMSLVQNKIDTERYHSERVKEYKEEKESLLQKEEKIKEEMNELKQKTRSSMELMMKEEAESNIYMEKRNVVLSQINEIIVKLDEMNNELNDNKLEIETFKQEMTVLEEKKSKFDIELNRTSDGKQQELDELYQQINDIETKYRTEKLKWDENLQTLITKLETLKQENQSLVEKKNTMESDLSTYQELKTTSADQFNQTIAKQQEKILQYESNIENKQAIILKYNELVQYKQRLENKIYDGELKRRDILNNILEYYGNIYIACKILNTDKSLCSSYSIDCLPNEKDIVFEQNQSSRTFSFNQIFNSDLPLNQVFEAISPYFLSSLDGYILNVLTFVPEGNKSFLFGNSETENEMLVTSQDDPMTPTVDSQEGPAPLTEDVEMERNSSGFLYFIFQYILTEIDKLKQFDWTYDTCCTYCLYTSSNTIVDLFNSGHKSPLPSPLKSLAPNGLKKQSLLSLIENPSILSLINQTKQSSYPVEPCLFTIFMNGTNKIKNLQVEGKLNLFVLQDINTYKKNNISFYQLIQNCANFVESLQNYSSSQQSSGSSVFTFNASALTSTLSSLTLLPLSNLLNSSPIPDSPKTNLATSPSKQKTTLSSFQEQLKKMSENGKIIALSSIDPSYDQVETISYLFDWLNSLNKCKLDKSVRHSKPLSS